MQTIREKVQNITQDLLMKTVDIKYGKVGITLDIHNGRITSIISSTTINVKDYFNEENPTMEEKNEK